MTLITHELLQLSRSTFSRNVRAWDAPYREWTAGKLRKPHYFRANRVQTSAKRRNTAPVMSRQHPPLFTIFRLARDNHSDSERYLPLRSHKTLKEQTVKIRFTAAALSLFLLFGAKSAHAQAGSLDTAFGTGGIVETSFGANSNNFSFFDAALAPNGDIVAAGTIENFNGQEAPCVIIRYLPTGVLDTTFGTGGIVTLTAPGFASLSGILAVQSTGKILVLTEPEINGTFVTALQRLNIDGQPDTTFGTGGQVVVNVTEPSPYTESPSLLLAQPDGKILLAGTATLPFRSKLTPLTVLSRYLSTGAPDTTFGTGGSSSVVAIETPTTLALLSGDGILALNDTNQIAQFSSTGALLSTPTGGTVIAVTQTGPVTFQSNADFLVGGGTQGPFGRRNIEAIIDRFLVSGVADSRFSSPAINFGANVPVVASGVSGIAVDSTGRIIIAGSFSNLSPAASEFGLARVAANGALDSTFGNDGTVTTTVGLESGIAKILLQSNNEIVAVGTTHVTNGSTTEDLAIARYRAQ